MDPFESRNIQPQRPRGQDISFAPVIVNPNENHKKFVFVDEHNRHRRLKVMRACEGCRKRKIKCDAATTNAWPCAACVRLKLTCVPPAMNFDKGSSGDGNGDSDSSDGDTKPIINEDHFSGFTSNPMMGTAPANFDVYQPGTFPDPHAAPTDIGYQLSPSFSNRAYDSAYASRGSTTGFPFQPDINYKSTIRSSIGSESGFRSETPAGELSEHLGDLKINENAIAPWITNQGKNLADAPAMEDAEVALPQSVSSDKMIRIPPEMMPSDQLAMQYFEYFFTNIHPYVPVLNRTYFFQQWQSNRHTISPLILEAIFACSSRLINTDNEGNQWLALISKHEDSFRDVPRLSTIQAMLLVLKAREAVAKRGYYYRSWMTIVHLIAMAKDLGLDEHYEDHLLGKSCNSTPYECAAKTRVWHSLFIVELMVGGPQGRTDFGVHMDTIDFDVPKSIQGLDETELRISQQFAYFLGVIKNVRSTALVYAKLRKRNPDFAQDPEFVRHNSDFEPWLKSLPPHLQVMYPDDGSPPYIPFHFVANIHTYHQLSIIMHHRPQLQSAAENMDEALTKQMLSICYSSATKLCRLQEAVLQNFGLPGVLSMLRGINFSIYSIMTCTMVHLVALTSPDHEIQEDARQYFPRHMRILEECMDSWPMPEMRAQIDSLRQAFSADTSKPFELKPTFPYNSPQAMSQHSPPSDTDFNLSGNHLVTGAEQPGQSLFRTVSGEPHILSGDARLSLDNGSIHSFSPMPTQNISQSVQTAESTGQWNPTRLFDQWQSAFFTPPPSANASQYTFTGPGPQDARSVPSNPFGAFASPTESINSPPLAQAMFASPVQRSPPRAPPVANYVTPSMWQEAVAGTYAAGVKRSWEDHSGNYGLKRAK